jgi:arylsulfatase
MTEAQSQKPLSRRGFLGQSLIAAAGAGLAAGEKAAAGRPNILVVCTDQQHWQAFGAADPFFETPAMNALARDGMTFSHHHTTTPQCSPARSSIYTGRYPHKTGVIGNINSIDHHGQPIPGLRPETETIGAKLKAAGYTTGYTGKWHLAREAHFSKQFDYAHLSCDAHKPATDLAISFLEDQAEKPEKPFALFVNYINPHDIYHVNRHLRDSAPETGITVPHPSSWADNLAGKPDPQRQFMKQDQGRPFHEKPDPYWEFYREFYRKKVQLVDSQFGRLAARLKALGLYENTLILFTSDHGDMDTHHRLVFKGPFMYEHMVRVPFIVRLPEKYGGRTGATSNAFTVHTDIVPTLCDFAGADAGAPDGRSLAPLLRGKTEDAARDSVVSQYYNKQKWVNPIRMLRTRDFKYNRYIRYGEELYDLKNDPHELQNLARDPGYEDVRKTLAAELDSWMREHGDTAFGNCLPTDRKGRPIRNA